MFKKQTLLILVLVIMEPNSGQEVETVQFFINIVDLWPHDAVFIVTPFGFHKHDATTDALRTVSSTANNRNIAFWSDQANITSLKPCEDFKNDVVLVENPEWDLTKSLSCMERYVWLMPFNRTKTFFSTALKLNSLVFPYEIDNGTVLLWETYSVQGRHHFEEVIGRWNSSHGFMATARSNIWERRVRLPGVRLKVAHLPWPPFTFMEYDDDPAQRTISRSYGIFPDIFRHLQEIMGFEYEEFLPPDGYWGGLEANSNSSWNGLIGMLQRREVDLSVGALTLIKERTHVVDFSLGLYEDLVTISLRRSQSRIIDVWAFILVFSEYSWLVILLIILCLTCGFFLIWRLMASAEDQESFNLLKSFSTVSTIFMQREASVPVSMSTRPSQKILHLTASITAFLVFSFYSGVLTSLMTATSPPVDIKSFTDVLVNDLNVFVLASSSDEIELKLAAKDSPLHKIYADRMGDGNFMNSADDIAVMLRQDPKNVIFGLSSTYLLEPEIVSPKLEDAMVAQFAFAFQKNSEFTDLFNFFLARLEESGVIKKIKRKWMPPEVSEKAHSVIDATELDYFNLIFPFVSVVTGIVASVTVVIAEYVAKVLKQI